MKRMLRLSTTSSGFSCGAPCTWQRMPFSPYSGKFVGYAIEKGKMTFNVAYRIEDRKLSAAVRSSLALADRHGLKSVAIPAISTGNYGFPVERCARILHIADGNIVGDETRVAKPALAAAAGQ